MATIIVSDKKHKVTVFNDVLERMVAVGTWDGVNTDLFLNYSLLIVRIHFFL